MSSRARNAVRRGAGAVMTSHGTRSVLNHVFTPVLGQAQLRPTATGNRVPDSFPQRDRLGAFFDAQTHFWERVRSHPVERWPGSWWPSSGRSWSPSSRSHWRAGPDAPGDHQLVADVTDLGVARCSPTPPRRCARHADPDRPGSTPSPPTYGRSPPNASALAVQHRRLHLHGSPLVKGRGLQLRRPPGARRTQEDVPVKSPRRTVIVGRDGPRRTAQAEVRTETERCSPATFWFSCRRRRRCVGHHQGQPQAGKQPRPRRAWQPPRRTRPWRPVSGSGLARSASRSQKRPGQRMARREAGLEEGSRHPGEPELPAPGGTPPSRTTAATRSTSRNPTYSHNRNEDY